MPEPTPEPEITELVESETTEPTEETDSIANYENIQILKNEYGFMSYGPAAAFFNSDIYYMRMTADITVGTDVNYQSVTISINNWQDAVKPYAKNAFNVYLPEKGEEVYSMVDAYYNGNGNQYLDKYHIIEGHKVYLHYFESDMIMQVTIFN